MRQGPGAGGAGKKGARTRCAGGGLCRLPIAICVRATAGLRRARALEPKRCVVAAQPQVCGRGHCQRTKIKQLGFQSQARRSCAGSRRRASRLGPEPLVRARLPSAARVRSKKREKGGRPKGTDSRGGAPDARPKTHALQNDTLRPEPAPAGMLQGLPLAAERRAVGWGKWGEALERALRRRPLPSCGAGRARAARSGLCRPPPGYFSTSPG